MKSPKRGKIKKKLKKFAPEITILILTTFTKAIRSASKKFLLIAAAKKPVALRRWTQVWLENPALPQEQLVLQTMKKVNLLSLLKLLKTKSNFLWNSIRKTTLQVMGRCF